jgi:two-component system response regulator YesN
LDTCKISIPQNTDQGYYTYNHKNSKYIVTYVRSDNGLTYVTLTPYTSVMKQVRYFKKLFTAMVTLSTLLCLIGIIMSIFKIQRPLKHLITYNFKLVNQIQLQESEIKSAILSRLISGTITNYEETEAELLSLKIPVSSKYFCVLKLIIEENFNGNDINVQQKTDTYVAAKTHIKKLADSQNKYILDMEVDSLAIIFATDKEEIQNCRLQIGETINTIQKTLETEGLSIYVGGGNFYNNIFDIHASYLEACFALKNAMPKEVSHVFWYDKLDYMPLFFYPQEVEQKMLLSIKRHDEPVIDEILDDLYDKNFCKLKISDSAAEMFLLKLLSTLLLAFSESSCENDELHQKIMSYAFNLQAKQQSYRTLFFPLKGFFKDICQLTKASSTIKSLEMQKNILEFINKHWSEQQMSLTYVSSAFDLSESYLSAMFKEQNNVNFMTYVENKRLEKACELLNNKKKTINEIAYEIGYTSSHSFRRAFKRKYGVTPKYFQANK